MSILVLGGNGFIGTHLVAALVKAGRRVRVFDRPGSLRAEPLPSVDYRFGEFADSTALTALLSDVEVVAHLIGTTVPATANIDPVGDISTNLVGTVRLLERMRECGVRRLVFLSSGGTVYGNTPVDPIPEDHRLAPVSSYGIVKAAIESYIAMFSRLYGFSVLVLRPANAYGPLQGHIGVQGVVPTFFRRALDGDEIRIWGDGEAVRDYIHISDLVDFMTLAIIRDLEGVFNVGSGVGVTLNALVAEIGGILGIQPRVVYAPERGFDVRRVVLDISKASAAVPWRPRISLRAGCEAYWRWLSN